MWPCGSQRLYFSMSFSGFLSIIGVLKMIRSKFSLVDLLEQVGLEGGQAQVVELSVVERRLNGDRRDVGCDGARRPIGRDEERNDAAARADLERLVDQLRIHRLDVANEELGARIRQRVIDARRDVDDQAVGLDPLREPPAAAPAPHGPPRCRKSRCSTRFASPSFRRTDVRAPTRYSMFISHRLCECSAQFPDPSSRRGAKPRSGRQILIRVTMRVVSSAKSGLPPALAFMPLRQEPVRERGEKDMNCDAGDRDQEERGKHSRDIEAETRTRRCDRRGPEPCPAEPAAISATIAPISARPPLIRRPARK